MTSNEVVEQLRQRINRLYPSASFQDGKIWKEFTFARTRVLRNKLNRRNVISALSYHKICLELQEATNHECSCVEINGCKTMRSKHQIPSYLQSEYHSTLTALDLKNKELSILPEEQVEDDIKYRLGYKGKAVASISNGYLFLYNANWENVQLRAVWSDPLEILFIQDCKPETNCILDDKNLIIISEELMLEMLDIATQRLIQSVQIPSDNTGDNNEKV
jgi:hypothetical protein